MGASFDLALIESRERSGRSIDGRRHLARHISIERTVFAG